MLRTEAESCQRLPGGYYERLEGNRVSVQELSHCAELDLVYGADGLRRTRLQLFPSKETFKIDEFWQLQRTAGMRVATAASWQGVQSPDWAGAIDEVF